MKNQTFIFASLFKTTTLKSGFDHKVINTLKASKQLHTYIVDAIECEASFTFTAKNNDGSISFSAYIDVLKAINKGDVKVPTMRLMHAVATAAVSIIGGEIPPLPQWAEKKEKPKKDTTGEPDTVDDSEMLIQSISWLGSVTDTTILTQVIKQAQARLDHIKASVGQLNITGANPDKPARTRGKRVKPAEPATV